MWISNVGCRPRKSEIIDFDPNLWHDVSSHLEIFFHGFVFKHLLNHESFIYCGSCDKVVVPENEINETEKAKDDAVICSLCSISFHCRCVDNTRESRYQLYSYPWIYLVTVVKWGIFDLLNCLLIVYWMFTVWSGLWYIVWYYIFWWPRNFWDMSLLYLFIFGKDYSIDR